MEVRVGNERRREREGKSRGKGKDIKLKNGRVGKEIKLAATFYTPVCTWKNTWKI